MLKRALPAAGSDNDITIMKAGETKPCAKGETLSILPNGGSGNTVETINHQPAESNKSGGDKGGLSDIELVRLTKKGISWASEHLIRRYYPKARALAYQMCGGNYLDAEDITQQAFLNVLGNIDRFEEKASFKTWFYRILVNTCLDAGRRRKRWLRLFRLPLIKRKDGNMEMLSPEDVEDQNENHDPSASFRNKRFRADVEKVLQRLPEKQRLVFQLKVIQELSISEISDVMGMAPGTVKSHLFRATHVMQEALAGWAGR